MCCCQKQLYIAKLAIAAACGGGAECALTANSQANCRRDVAILLYTAKPTARQGQGHCTLLWISRNTLEFLWKTKFSRRSHITWALISLKFASFVKFVPWFGLIFGLFWPFCEGNAPFADFRSRLPDCNRSMRRRRWRLCQNFCTLWH